ncbi:prolyl 4-hydroxylase subunit alpha-1-like [Ixodes scapularis]
MRKTWCWITAALLFRLVTHSSGQGKTDFYTTVSTLSDLIQMEKEVKASLLYYTKRLKIVQDSVLNFVQDSQPYDDLATPSDVFDYLKHPVHAFQLIKRMTAGLGDIETQIRRMQSFDSLVDIREMRKQRLLPWDEDFRGLAASLVRLQNTYDLDISELAKGHLRTEVPQSRTISGRLPLSARDCLNISQVALDQGFYDRAVEWVEQAVRTAAGEGNVTTSKQELDTFHETVVKEHDENLDTTQETTDSLVDIREMRKQRLLPWDEDFRGLAASLVRLQNTYDLDISELAKGHLRTEVPQSRTISGRLPLSARDCLNISQVALDQGFYDRAVEWVEQAVRTAAGEGNVTTSKQELDTFHETVVKEHDENLDTTQETTAWEGFFWQTYGVPVRDRMKRSKEYKAELFQEDPQEYQDSQNYKRLCRGEQLRTLKMDSQLRCRYYKGQDGFFKLQPIKLEEFNLKPYIVVLHDVIQDRDLEDLIAFAKPRLMISKTYSDDMELSPIRTSSNTWLFEQNATIASRLNRYLTALLGMGTSDSNFEAEPYQLANYGTGGHYLPHHDYLYDVYEDSDENATIASRLNRYLTALLGMGTSDSNFEAEPYQLANYGTGGHYLPHHDYLYDVYEDSDETDDFSRLPSYGDRLATLMIYMSDVEEGGATVFPKLGVRLTPKKGDAAFWWNLKTSGAVEKLTLHAGCPVLYGNKWIANKWFRSYGNVFRLPCSTDRYASMAPLV